MGLESLDHYFVRANDLEATRAFYCDVLGFDVMPRPNFPFPGYWLGVNGRVQVHMGQNGIPDQEHVYAGTRADSVTDQTGVVDHIAFSATDPTGVSRRLTEHGVESEHRWIGGFGIAQLFVHDPNGVVVELNFHGLTDEPAWS
jgi:catechol 2,3-dioxygenase-like lactoylglutathione lyase family enzyme